MTNTDLQDQASAKWGSFRKFIAKNPLSGFWIGVAFGAVVVAGILRAVF